MRWGRGGSLLVEAVVTEGHGLQPAPWWSRKSAEKKYQMLPLFPSAGTCRWLSGKTKLLSQYSPGWLLDSRVTQRRGDQKAERAVEAAPGRELWPRLLILGCQESGGMAQHEALQNPFKSPV